MIETTSGPIGQYQRLILSVRFITPAFLGNAEQQGQWRTPPFKALLRQWWRVAAAKDYGFDHRLLREAEGRLFGHSWLSAEDKDARIWAMKSQTRIWAMKSQIRMQLLNWQKSRSENWNKKDQSLVYLGYGPIQKPNASLQSGAESTLSIIQPRMIANPEAAGRQLSDTLQLIHWFGTLGGRSRNGWGSLEITTSDDRALQLSPLSTDHSLLKTVTREYSQCLQLEWPHALGKDDKGILLWHTNPCNDWLSAMHSLSQLKKQFRKQLQLAKEFSPGHLVAYPVKEYDIPEWRHVGDSRKPARLSNQLRFKVLRVNNRYIGLAFHLPCQLPRSLRTALRLNDNQIAEMQLQAWRTAHQYLDEYSDSGLKRFEGDL